ncbi:hypothetical protein QWY79_03875, partial [Halomonas sabkhae]|uniref:hypothetical protein n=1 Tax=Halomonas sabkhae TaxID=626223 RepID=UPI0025B5FE58
VISAWRGRRILQDRCLASSSMCCRANDAASKGGFRSSPWRTLQEVVRILPKSAALSIDDFRRDAEKRQEKQWLPPLSTAGEVGPSPAADAYYMASVGFTQGVFEGIFTDS